MQTATIEGYRLSPQQRRLWRLQRECAALLGSAYARVEVTGRVDEEALKQAVREVVSRHEILRTSYERVGATDDVVQVIDESNEIEIEEVDCSSRTEEEQEREIGEVVEEARRRRWKGEEGLRVWVIRKREGGREMVVSVEAMSLDSVGLCNLVRDIANSYEALIHNQKWTEQTIQYV